MKRFSITSNCTDKRPRQGVTLIEVLMSLMIMSIGVASVAALFPISVLRTVQANQLTNGAIVKYNVEAMLQSDPTWIIDPDRDGDLVEHFRLPQNRNYVVDPIGFYTHFADGNYLATEFFGNGSIVPLRRWGGGLPTLPETALSGTFPGGMYRVPDMLAPPPDAKYARALRLSAIAKAGQGDGWTTDIDAVPVGLINSPNGFIGAQLPANLDLTAMPTSASTLLANNYLPLPPHSSTAPPSAIPLTGSSPSEFLIPDPELYRVVLFSVDGRRSQAYPLTAINPMTNEVFWSEDIDSSGPGSGTGNFDFNMSGTTNSATDIRALPREFGGAVSRVILQSRRLTDFSWMLTVRRRSDGFVRGTDIVVRAKNGADFKDEQLFAATFIKDTNIVGIRYPYRTTPGDTTVPSLRRGKFVFDAQNALWYRIQDYKERPLGNIGWSYPQYDAVVYTETEITEPGGEDQFTLFDSSGTISLLLNGALDPGQFNASGIVQQPFTLVGGVPTALSEAEARPGNGDTVLDFGAAMFPSGVVDVYPMGSMPLPSSL
jgi:prepilin-type N-terminal cleavage/methylation domain-containing protein